MANKLDPYGDSQNPVGSMFCVSCKKKLVLGEYGIVTLTDNKGAPVDYGLCTPCFEDTPSWVWGQE